MKSRRRCLRPCPMNNQRKHTQKNSYVTNAHPPPLHSNTVAALTVSDDPRPIEVGPSYINGLFVVRVCVANAGSLTLWMMIIPARHDTRHTCRTLPTRHANHANTATTMCVCVCYVQYLCMFVYGLVVTALCQATCILVLRVRWRI